MVNILIMKPTNDTKRIEAYGVKGMKNTQWRKTFASVAAMNKWAEKHGAEILGTRDAEVSQ